MDPINQRETAARHRRVIRELGDEIRKLREDAGLSQRAVASAAKMAQAHLSAIEAGTAEPSLRVLQRLGAALGSDLSVRYFVNTGPRVRDRLQLLMEQAALELAHGRWRADLEVPVHRPVRGVIDLVLHDQSGADTVASEAHSRLLRVEQQIRWANEKADALAGLPSLEGRRVCRLLLLRNTAANRDLVRAAEAVFVAAYPGRAAEAFAALTGPTTAFPMAALLWVDVKRGRARLLAAPPRGVSVGR
jgi:transcriptional regulator with XRE-family HTH domain